ncbi:restriction endonuclease subunit S [Aliarcobacter butzleri]
MSKNMNVPKLRFKEFDGEWEEKKLKTISVKIGSGSTPRGGEQVYKTSGIPFIRSQNVNHNKLIFNDVTYIDEKIHNSMRNSTVKANDILLNITGASIGRSCVVPKDFKEGNVNQHVCIIRLKDNYEPSFLQSFLSSFNGQKLIYQGQTGSGREGINFQSIGAFKLNLPSKQEQEKIASFLTSVDTKIEQLTKKEELLQQYKKGVMQKIFSQEIRFKADDGSEFCDWEEKKLGDLLNECKEKSTMNNQFDVLSSTKDSVVLQSEYFNREIASSDNTGYKILRVNQLVFSPQNLWLGNINVNTKYEVGIVSPSYKIYDFKNNFLVQYAKYFIKIPRMMYEYGQASEQGASVVRRSLNIELFNSILISLPSVEEQTKIANFLSSIDSKIEQVQKQLNSTKEFKKALLQQMFV